MILPPIEKTADPRSEICCSFPRRIILSQFLSMEMLVQSYWLLCLLFISTSIAAPSPTPSAFYLVVAGPSTLFDGDYIYVSVDPREDNLYLPQFGTNEPDPTGLSVFSLSAECTLQQDSSSFNCELPQRDGCFGGLVSSSTIRPLSTPLGRSRRLCEIVDGALTRPNGAMGVFYACPATVIAGELVIPNVGLGPIGSLGDLSTHFVGGIYLDWWEGVRGKVE